MNESENKQQSAFPLVAERHEPEFGLSKRELIAAMCPQGILANPSLTQMVTNSSNSFTIIGTTRAGAVKVAAAHADALLCELEKPTNEPVEVF